MPDSEKGPGTGAVGAKSPSRKQSGEEVRVGVIGTGQQGRALIEVLLRIPGVRVCAICDLWAYARALAADRLALYRCDTKQYETCDAMLADRESLGLDAAVVATPDWLHAPQANACMRAGLDVYCEKPMAESIENARAMIRTARETGRLLQIGYQRRSNPRYLHAIDTLVRDVRLLGRVTHGYAQWNRSKHGPLGWPNAQAMDSQFLEDHGYGSMEQFRNWRHYRRYGSGPMADLGSAQLDVFIWALGVAPKALIAGGGRDYYTDREWFDNAMCIYEFENAEGTSRVFYQTLDTTKRGRYYETFMGVDGSMVISENIHNGNGALREDHLDTLGVDGMWERWVMKGYLREVPAPPPTPKKNALLDVRVTPPSPAWPLPIDLAKPVHQPHLENFFNAIRLGEPLRCSAETAYPALAATLAFESALRAERRQEFSPEDFRV